MRLCTCVVICLSLLLSVAAIAAPGVPSYHLVKSIAVGGDGGWDYLTFDGRSHRLYISRATRVMVLDVDNGTVIGEIPNTQGVHGIALDRRGNRGYTSNGKDNSVSVFDLETLKELNRITVGTGPDSILFDRASKRVFTFNGKSQDASAIDVTTGTVVGTVPLGGKPETALADGKGQIFVNIEDKNEIVDFDANTLVIKNRWSIEPCEGASGLAMDRKNHRLFAVCHNEMMAVVDSDSGKVIATPPIGKGPDAAAFYPADDIAFSSNGRDGTLTLVQEVDPNTFTVVATVPTQLGARTMAIDPRTGTIYLATAQFLPVPPPAPGETQTHRRREMIPNSFVILVFGK